MREILAKLSLPDAISAQARAQAMLGEFFTDRGDALVQAGHPWSWFVQRFDGLRLPRPARASRARTKTDENVAALADWEPPKASNG